MNITSAIFEAYLKCPTKCFLRAHGETETGNLYADWVRTEHDAYQNTGGKRLKETFTPDEIATGLTGTDDLKSAKWRLALDVVAQTGKLESRIHAVERIPPEGRGRAAQFIPVRFIFRNKLTTDDKLILAFDALVLSEMLGRSVSMGKIIHGDDHSALKVKTAGLGSRVGKLTIKIGALLATDKPPDLVLNRHCGECEFQTRCRQKAVDKDDLSLLSRMSDKERKKLNSKGIFTVTQLSYTFRPRRRSKKLRDKKEQYHHSLKALAIRENKIHIVETPELKIEGTPVYFDVEGLPDRDFYYLIGVRIGEGESTVQHSLWADTAEDEKRIWQDFLAILNGIVNPVLIHYGNYETIFLKQMCKRYGCVGGDWVATNAISFPLNLVSHIYGQIYFPTHSNSLKQVAGWLGFHWSRANMSGLESVVSRQYWEHSRDMLIKQKLIVYNKDDCAALQKTFSNICQFVQQRVPPIEHGGHEVINTDSLKCDTPFHFGKTKFSMPEYDYINKAAYWDYQHDKIQVRKTGAARKTSKRANRRHSARLSVNTVIDATSLVFCPVCSAPTLTKKGSLCTLIRDLKFNQAGVKKWVVKYLHHRYRCARCKSTFTDRPADWVSFKEGQGLFAFVIYQLIELRLSHRSIENFHKKMFCLKVPRTLVHRLKT